MPQNDRLGGDVPDADDDGRQSTRLVVGHRQPDREEGVMATHDRISHANDNDGDGDGERGRSPSLAPSASSSWYSRDARPSAVALYVTVFGWQRRFVLSAPTSSPAAPSRFSAHLFVNRFVSIPITFSELEPVDWEREAEEERNRLKKGFSEEKAAWTIASLFGAAICLTILIFFTRFVQDGLFRPPMTWHSCIVGHKCVVHGPTKFWAKSVYVHSTSMRTHWVDSVPPLLDEERSFSISGRTGSAQQSNFELYTVKGKTITVDFEVPFDLPRAIILSYWDVEGNLQFNLTDLAMTNQTSLELMPNSTDKALVLISGWSAHPSSKNFKLTVKAVLRDYTTNKTLSDCAPTRRGPPFPVPGRTCELASTHLPSFSRYIIMADPTAADDLLQFGLQSRLRIAPVVVVYVLLSVLLLACNVVTVLAVFRGWTLSAWLRERKKRRGREVRGDGAAALSTRTTATDGAVALIPEEQQSLLVRVDED
ncbi:hypothetical protein DFJ73DRAFT_965966 [Zopfochytrium polystomum]|nr:hypothetical protein DFJ73DRAFT_965966 [Zopfochytrium polystomum]